MALYLLPIYIYICTIYYIFHILFHSIHVLDLVAGGSIGSPNRIQFVYRPAQPLQYLRPEAPKI